MAAAGVVIGNVAIQSAKTVATSGSLTYRFGSDGILEIDFSNFSGTIRLAPQAVSTSVGGLTSPQPMISGHAGAASAGAASIAASELPTSPATGLKRSNIDDADELLSSPSSSVGVSDDVAAAMASAIAANRKADVAMSVAAETLKPAPGAKTAQKRQAAAHPSDAAVEEPAAGLPNAAKKGRKGKSASETAGSSVSKQPIAAVLDFGSGRAVASAAATASVAGGVASSTSATSAAAGDDQAGRHASVLSSRISPRGHASTAAAIAAAAAVEVKAVSSAAPPRSTPGSCKAAAPAATSGSAASATSAGVEVDAEPQRDPAVEQAYESLLVNAATAEGGICKAILGCQLVQASVAGKQPEPRWGHAAVAVDDHRILVHGGQGEDGEARNDTYILDLAGLSGGSNSPSSLSAVWRSEGFTGVDTQARVWHSMVHVKEKDWTVALGGVPSAEASNGASGSSNANSGSAFGANGEQTDDLFVFDPTISLWYPPGVGGKLPSKRSGHSMTLVPNARLPNASSASSSATDTEPMIVVFGGIREKNGRNTWLNDLYVWPVSSHKWVHLQTTEGRAPMPRCYHAAAAVGSKLVVFGGNSGDSTFGDVSYLHCSPTTTTRDTWTWHTPPIQAGTGPCARTGATATAIGDRFILITGGWDPDEEEETEKAAAAQKGKRPATSSSAAASSSTSSSKGRGRVSAGAAASSAPAAASLSGSKRSRDQTPAKSASAADAASSSTASAAAAASVLALDPQREPGQPHFDAWLLDTEAWEWIRVLPDVPPPASAAPSHAQAGSSSSAAGDEQSTAVSLAALCGRVGHTAVYMADVTGLLPPPHATAQPSSSSSSAAAIGGPVPGLVLFGGLKSDQRRYSDTAVLVLPPALVAASAAPSLPSGASAAVSPRGQSNAAAVEHTDSEGHDDDEVTVLDGRNSANGAGAIGAGTTTSSTTSTSAADEWDIAFAQPNPPSPPRR